MARLEIAPEVLDDFDRFLDHAAQRDIGATATRIAQAIQAIQILETSPLVGRPVAGGKRELVIGHASNGYVALYRYVPTIDTVIVLAIRAQRKSGYKRDV